MSVAAGGRGPFPPFPSLSCREVPWYHYEDTHRHVQPHISGSAPWNHTSPGSTGSPASGPRGYAKGEGLTLLEGGFSGWNRWCVPWLSTEAGKEHLTRGEVRFGHAIPVWHRWFHVVDVLIHLGTELLEVGLPGGTPGASYLPPAPWCQVSWCGL